jgi:hypothetical protein
MKQHLHNVLNGGKKTKGAGDRVDTTEVTPPVLNQAAGAYTRPLFRST